MNNTTIIKTFNSDNSNIANINKKHQQIMTIITITNIILQLETMIKKLIVTNHIYYF